MSLTTVHIVFGPQGAGKTTYSRKLADESNATRFSIDEWMGELFGQDLKKPIDYRWVMERVQRCERRIWATASEVAKRGGNVVLDLGFMKINDRSRFISLSEGDNLPAQLHFVSAPHDVRRSRVISRNTSKGDTFAFEVTPTMFDFMEGQFEPPTEVEQSKAIAFSSA